MADIKWISRQDTTWVMACRRASLQGIPKPKTPMKNSSSGSSLILNFQFRQASESSTSLWCNDAAKKEQRRRRLTHSKTRAIGKILLFASILTKVSMMQTLCPQSITIL
jgi:hypothetical protein